MCIRDSDYTVVLLFEAHPAAEGTAAVAAAEFSPEHPVLKHPFAGAPGKAAAGLAAKTEFVFVDVRAVYIRNHIGFEGQAVVIVGGVCILKEGGQYIGVVGAPQQLAAHPAVVLGPVQRKAGGIQAKGLRGVGQGHLPLMLHPGGGQSLLDIPLQIGVKPDACLVYTSRGL